MTVRPKVIAFDMIETVFSLESMRPRLAGLGLPDSELELWFVSALRNAFALAITDRFSPFRVVLRGSLVTLLAQHRLPMREEPIEAVLDGMSELEPHFDAARAFAVLADEGFRIVALSNGAADTTEHLLWRSDLKQYVEAVLSVEEVQRSKPRREVYLHVAEVCGVAPEEIALVATHSWDTHGAKAAGLMSAFVARGQPYLGVMLQPDVQGETLLDVAHALANLS